MEQGQPSNVYFKIEGDQPETVYFQIKPSAIRFQQSQKGSSTNTLGGYYRELLYSDDPQYSGLQLASLTVEATSGVRYRKELLRIDQVRRAQGIPKIDGKLADIYFYDLITIGDWNGIQRDASRIYLVNIDRFSFDDTIQSPNEIKYSFAFTILRDMTWAIDEPLSAEEESEVTPLVIAN